MLAYILHNQVVHTRFLPQSSKHSFVYPTLSFLVSLHALENKDLDLLGGWLFGYGNTWGRLTGLRASGYLYDTPSDDRSIKNKLMDVLDRHGHAGSELHDAWLMTMPRMLGIEGINPLSVYFCYRRASAELWVVVLEVHNTFGERHVYVLHAKDQSAQPPSSRFHYAWTFPRQFHVSPFNDRSGYYTCQLTAPLHPPGIPTPTSSLPHPIIKIILFTSPPNPLKKLTALTRTTTTTPLTPRTLLTSLFLSPSAPLNVLLVFPRILLQAYRLHYEKRLNVYRRPEPCAFDPAVERCLPRARNATQVRGGAIQMQGGSTQDARIVDVGHGVGWQRSGFLERWCQRRVYAFLRTQCTHTHTCVTFIPANPHETAMTFHHSPQSLNGGTCFNCQGQPECLDQPQPQSQAKDQVTNQLPPNCTLTIHYRSPHLFTILFATPSPAHALLLGVHVERVFSVSSEDAFNRVFTAPVSKNIRYTLHPSLWTRLAQYIRISVLPCTLTLPTPPTHTLDYSTSPRTSLPTTFLTAPFTGFTPVLVLLALAIISVLERGLFSVVGVRFVRGEEVEGWGAWGSVREEGSVWGGLGSVREEGKGEGGEMVDG